MHNNVLIYVLFTRRNNRNRNLTNRHCSTTIFSNRSPPRDPSEAKKKKKKREISKSLLGERLNNFDKVDDP